MSFDLWKKNLDRSFGSAPKAPTDEFDRILRKTRQDQSPAHDSPLWSTLLCVTSLALGIMVTIFVKPNVSTSSDTQSSSLSLLSIEVTSPYDESLEVLQNLSEGAN